jgi:hypothetical protein
MRISSSDVDIHLVITGSSVCIRAADSKPTTLDTGAFGGLPDAEDDVEMLRLGMSD